MAEPQVSTLASSGSSALFLILSVGPSEADAARVREVCAMVPTLVRSIGRRDSAAGLSCVVGMGADAWDRLVPGRSRPLQLHPFRALADGHPQRGMQRAAPRARRAQFLSRAGARHHRCSATPPRNTRPRHPLGGQPRPDRLSTPRIPWRRAASVDHRRQEDPTTPAEPRHGSAMRPISPNGSDRHRGAGARHRPQTDDIELDDAVCSPGAWRAPRSCATARAQDRSPQSGLGNAANRARPSPRMPATCP